MRCSSRVGGLSMLMDTHMYMCCCPAPDQTSVHATCTIMSRACIQNATYACGHVCRFSRAVHACMCMCMTCMEAWYVSRCRGCSCLMPCLCSCHVQEDARLKKEAEELAKKQKKDVSGMLMPCHVDTSSHVVVCSCHVMSCADVM